MRRRKSRDWSLADIDYLKHHRHEPVNQLCIALSQSAYAVKSKLKELESSGEVKPGPTTPTKKSGRKSKIGKRPDCDNLFFRSSWESNFYRYLKTLKNIKIIEYEPTTFTFTNWGIVTGTVSYTPDFKITYTNGTYSWIEVKGFLKPQDKTKIRRFKKYYPSEAKKLVAMTGTEKCKAYQFFTDQDIKVKWKYPELHKKFKDIIKGWEG